MPAKTNANSETYETMVVGAAYLVKNILKKLDFVAAVNEELTHQPQIETTYGELAQIIVANRLAFQPVPLYEMGAWAAEQGLDQVFGLEAVWLDDDRLGAMLEGLATHQVSIWSRVIKNAVDRFNLDLSQLHSDTTSVYFEGQYEDEVGQPLGGGERVPLLVEGYNKDGQRHKVQFVLSLMVSQRVPVWYRPWDGNQTDEPVYLADLTALRQAVLMPDNTLLIGDRKLCTTKTMLTFCRQQQWFLAPHPWTDPAKGVWWRTWQQLEAGQLQWRSVEYVSRNNARKPAHKRPQYRVCEVAYTLKDAENPPGHTLRWVFVWSSDKAERDVRQRNKALQAAQAALHRLSGLLGKYDYTDRSTIEGRLTKALQKAKASKYFVYTLSGSDETQDWHLHWEPRQAVITESERFDGISLLCTNAPDKPLSSGEVMIKYKEQVRVEQTIDFIKSPVQIRPMWLHSPKRLAGLTLLIMIAVLVAALLEHQVRRWIANTGRLVRGLRPEGRDDPYPTAKAMLRAFQYYAVVIVHHGKRRQETHHPKLRPVQQQIWDILQLDPLPP
jgi:transposase